MHVVIGIERRTGEVGRGAERFVAGCLPLQRLLDLPDPHRRSADAEAHQAAGLTLEGLWRDIDDPQEVILIFQVSDLEKARAIVSAPAAVETARKAGVTDGAIWFVQ